MLNKISKVAITSVTALAPALVSAQEILGGTKKIFEGLLSLLRNTLIPLVFTLALLCFFWGVVKYIWAEGSGKDEGKKIMIWGIIALFVMSSVWGIVAFIQSNLLGTTSPSTVPIPTIGSPSDLNV